MVTQPAVPILYAAAMAASGAGALAHLVPATSRARAYGIFSAVFGIAWFLGSALLGALYDISIPLLVIVSIAAELAALIPFVMATRLTKV